MRRAPVWLWINLLSLDGPLVALVWQDFLSRCYPGTLMPQDRSVLGLTVWAIYLGDRLLDIRGASAELDRTPVHRFYRLHRRAVGVLLALVVGCDFLVTVHWLPEPVLAKGLILSAATGGYLRAFSGELPARRVFLKKFVASFLFAAGVFLVASGWQNPLNLLVPAGAFALLCKGNLLLTELWERGRHREQTWPALLFFGLLCAASGRSGWYYAIAISSAGLASLSLWGRALSGDARRVLADAVLMSPLLLR